jgi:hypothetical protein
MQLVLPLRATIQNINVQHNLVPRACDPREGTRGSGIIRCRKPGILAKDWTTHYISTANQIPPWNGLSQSLTFLPEDRRLRERDCVQQISLNTINTDMEHTTERNNPNPLWKNTSLLLRSFLNFRPWRPVMYCTWKATCVKCNCVRSLLVSPSCNCFWTWHNWLFIFWWNQGLSIPDNSRSQLFTGIF